MRAVCSRDKNFLLLLFHEVEAARSSSLSRKKFFATTGEERVSTSSRPTDSPSSFSSSWLSFLLVSFLPARGWSCVSGYAPFVQRAGGRNRAERRKSFKES